MAPIAAPTARNERTFVSFFDCVMFPENGGKRQ